MVQDLARNKLVAFQHKHYLMLTILMNVMSILIAGSLCNDFFGAAVFVFLLRLFCIHHATFSINSFAHLLGEQPFSKKCSAVNNWFVSLFTFGEGNHNYHHAFAYDYRNGPIWYNFDPTKWFIWGLNKVGLASQLKRVETHKIYRALLIEKTSRLLCMIDKKYALRGDLKQMMILKVHQKNSEINHKITELKEMAFSYYQLQKEWQSKHPALKKLMNENLKNMKKCLKTQQLQFKQLYNEFQLSHLINAET